MQDSQQGHIKKAVSVALAVLLIGQTFYCSFAGKHDIQAAAASDDLYQEQQTDAPDYAQYLALHKSAARPDEQILIEASSYEKGSSQNIKAYTNYASCPGVSILLPDDGSVTYNFKVEKPGIYNLKFLYYTVSETGNAALRDILVDGALPFLQSADVSFERVWKNSDDNRMQFDSSGNQIRARQVETDQWREKPAEDASGYYSEPLCYYFTAGEHTLSLVAKREILLLHSITLYQEKEAPSYASVKKSYEQKGFRPASDNAVVTVEAENASAKSDQTMYPLADRTSPTVTPDGSKKIRYNTIGGSQWEEVGQWIEWKVTVKESGLYNIAMHFKQALKVNDISIRELTIDGRLPFAEAASLPFYYSGNWQDLALGDENGQPYEFYFTEGVHTIRLRASMGRYSDALSNVKKQLMELNKVYREIVVVTGASPDQYRDYQLDKQIPDVISEMKLLSRSLKGLESQIKSLNHAGGQSTAAIHRLYQQLDQMTNDTDTIAYCLTSFKDNISSYGTWMNGLLQQPLEMDRLQLVPAGAKLPKGDANFFQLSWYYIEQFAESFLTDYSSIGVTDTSKKYEKIKVWTSSGRDQSQILKQMINDEFTTGSGISVDLQLVSATALLPSIVSGTGPDVYIGLAQTEPVNMAMRHAITNLSSFPDFQKISGRFYPQALIPFHYLGGTYAVPDTMTYLMLFYRSDILKEMNIPLTSLKTWDSILKDVLPKLEINSQSFGITPNIQSYLTFLYQQNGSLYLNGGKESAFSSSRAISAMKEYSILYTQYGLPLSFDFANRFRTGEMPIGVVDLMMYNQLAVFAPEIKGLWGMLPVPATIAADGSLNNTTVTTVTGTVLLSRSKHQEAAWKFLKWWSSVGTQEEYGTELESVVGAAARYNSANKQAMDSVQWDYNVRRSIKKQLESIQALPEVPGGYLTTRDFDFAFRYIVYDHDNLRQTMNDATENINHEIAGKRQEYHLN